MKPKKPLPSRRRTDRFLRTGESGLIEITAGSERLARADTKLDSDQAAQNLRNDSLMNKEMLTLEQQLSRKSGTQPKMLTLYAHSGQKIDENEELSIKCVPKVNILPPNFFFRLKY
ncbi:hypothetical protein QWJ34_05780 [Saccharibacillus sp. CPCC 101409]|uniref:hypothetical protein n=1 Tax=Saccharibacillus sp. CPCC 101409 TaxID=3058041 RepID=UPI00267160CC|nr:hypothetical protein [Saccharibacillus sp. CPCC 101409]MDO3409264.1 hypothetical protein [Saccharibacillus sp. CPCC 101409]